MMKKLFHTVEDLVEQEYERASENYGSVNNSNHESYAVLREECDEAHEETIMVEVLLGKYWSAVKTNDENTQRMQLRELYRTAMLAACEYIQSAAMAKKALKTIEALEENKEITGEEE